MPPAVPDMLCTAALVCCDCLHTWLWLASATRRLETPCLGDVMTARRMTPTYTLSKTLSAVFCHPCHPSHPHVTHNCGGPL